MPPGESYFILMHAHLLRPVCRISTWPWATMSTPESRLLEWPENIHIKSVDLCSANPAPTIEKEAPYRVMRYLHSLIIKSVFFCILQRAKQVLARC